MMGKLLIFIALATLLSGALSEYYISKEALNFMQAYATCKRYGYSLTKERSLEDSDAINSAIEEADETSRDFFIGGMNESSGVFESEWLWLENGEKITYDHWTSGASRNSECLIRASIRYGEGYWLSTSCSETHYFICEY